MFVASVSVCMWFVSCIFHVLNLFAFVRAVLHVVLPWFPCWCVCFGFSCISVCTVVSVLSSVFVGVGFPFASVLLSVVVSSHVVVSVFVLSKICWFVVLEVVFRCFSRFFFLWGHVS